MEGTTEVNEFEQRRLKIDVELYEAEQKAKITRIEAEAKLYAAQQEALGTEAKGKAEATAIASKGEAEAAAIAAKGEAEAAAMDKKAEAFKKYDKAAMLEMLVNILPSVAKEVATPLSAVKDVHVYGSTGGEITGFSANTPAVIKQAFDVIQNVTGVDLKRIAQDNSTVIATEANIGK